MKTNVIMEQLSDLAEGSITELCRNEIPGVHAFYHVLSKGESRTITPDNAYHIFVIIEGSPAFYTDDTQIRFDGRGILVPSPVSKSCISTGTKAMILEIQWDIADGDKELLKEYRTIFPIVAPYETSIQYVDPNKSPKTISRMMIPHEVLPRFTIGSVESYGYDVVKPHSHPMLDQFFYSFPENDMKVIIDDEKISMQGNRILHIPLGSNHGVEVEEGRHMHYIWIDFLPDNKLGLERLNARHKVTGTMRSFREEQNG